jgi:hypothetical protein
MGFFAKLLGTIETFFHIGGPNRPGWKYNNFGENDGLEARAFDDSDFCIVRGKDPVANNDLVTLEYFNDNTLAPIADKNLLANTSGGSARPIATTLTALIDEALGSSQGNILYRDASAWKVLAPGTSGQFLETLGASANPAWGNAYTNTGIYGDGSDGDVTISADTSLTRDMFYHNLTVNTGINLFNQGFRIFVQNTLTLNGTISADGKAGTGTASGTGGKANNVIAGFAGTTPLCGGGGGGANGSGGSATTFSWGGSSSYNTALGSGTANPGTRPPDETSSSGANTVPRSAVDIVDMLVYKNGALTGGSGVTFQPVAGGGGGPSYTGGFTAAGGAGGGVLVVAARITKGNGTLSAQGGNGFVASANAIGYGGGGGVIGWVSADISGWTGSTSVVGGATGKYSTTGTNVAATAGTLFQLTA